MVEKQGPDFYDQDEVFITYMQGYRREDGPTDTLERPVLMDLLGDVSGKRVLDLGCGIADFGRELFGLGCRSYLGVEGSANMLREALKVLSGTPGEVVHANLETWLFPELSFDLVVSRLAIHYIEDTARLFGQAYGCLAAGGRLVFSVEHPVITSSDKGWKRGGPRQDWVVDNYFDSGKRVTEWMGGMVVKYHRTVEEYFLGLQQAGFLVESLRETCPRREFFASEETYLRRKRIPLFLILAARK